MLLPAGRSIINSNAIINIALVIAMVVMKREKEKERTKERGKIVGSERVGGTLYPFILFLFFTFLEISPQQPADDYIKHLKQDLIFSSKQKKKKEKLRGYEKWYGLDEREEDEIVKRRHFLITFIIKKDDVSEKFTFPLRFHFPCVRCALLIN